MIGNFVGAPIGGAVNTSGTLYSQAISIATAGILSVSFHAGRVVMLHMTAMGSVSFGPKQIAKAITTAATGAVTFVKSVGKTITAGITASITHAFSFVRFITRPNTIGKQITTTSPESDTNITTSRSLPRQITS